MGIAQLLRARHVGIRELKNGLSGFISRGEPIVATDRGEPKSFLVPYEEMVELAEMIEEASDSVLVAQVREARAAYRRGEGIPVSRLWKKLGLTRRGRAGR
jgi:prevent-host-death family protein